MRTIEEFPARISPVKMDFYKMTPVALWEMAGEWSIRPDGIVIIPSNGGLD